ncbi:hypothetical protein [Streptomyces coffeae]|uniref:Uncharacterized protein n=1 Tax=Streptomyces coffeae TaxID=621382 RepID=A0ABS1NBY9_9ACTN|nr:hypothetical protein [Streptomyces coffeae]MBL1097462.1 hypothetical protein [Streptomyces coffeae]
MGARSRLRGIGDAVTSAAGTVTSAAGTVTSAAAGVGRNVLNRGTAAGRSGMAASGDWVVGVLGALPAPAAPATEEWEFSLGALVCRHPRVPAITARALRPLDSIGALRFGPESVGFDGEDIPWKQVVRLQLHDAFSAMTTDGFDAEIDRVRDLLPPLPGRKWAVTKVVEGLGAVALAALEQSGEQRLDTREVACEIVYGGLLGREKSLRAHLFTTALLAQQPEVAHSLVVTAESMGVPVLPAEPGRMKVEAAERVRALRRRTDAVAAQLGAAAEDEAVDGAGSDDTTGTVDTPAQPETPPQLNAGA